MRFIIAGAGAIGTALGGYLASAGRGVILISRPSHAAAIQSRGMVLRTAKGTVRPELTAVTSANDVKWNNGNDVIFLTCKSQHTQAVLDELKGASRETPIFCFQNGVRNEEWAGETFTKTNSNAASIASPAPVPNAATAP